MQDHTLTTVAEESGFSRTGRTDEVTRLCAAFAAAWPRAVRSLEFGRSAEGRPMRALIACRADARQVPVLMLQAGIHPGESDGKDANQTWDSHLYPIFRVDELLAAASPVRS